MPGCQCRWPRPNRLWPFCADLAQSGQDYRLLARALISISGPSGIYATLACSYRVMAQLPELAGTRLVSPPRGAPPSDGSLSREGTGSAASVRGHGRWACHPAPRPGVLLDRDGTIIVDHGHVGSVDRVELIDGAAEAIARFNRARVPVAVVTNQAGVARGLYHISDVEEVHRYIASLLAEHGAHIDQFFYCPYHLEGVVAEFARASADRKPLPGMARAAAQALNLDLTSSWVVGDRPEDIGLAEAVGASAIYVGPDACNRPGVWSFPSLSLATSFILERIAV
jgi:histidinol-phosphate phosphatase family protein